jgi:signal-transduction protein with cAMP-binding, CBS, and nucleotidyltransferase domain
MNSPVQSVNEGTGVHEIAKMMSSLKIGSVVVTKGGKPVGIITDGDIVSRVVATDMKASKLRAADVMTAGLHRIPSDDDITHAARAMIKKGIKRLGVERRGELIGIVSMSDVLRVTPDMMDVLSEKSRILAGERPRTSAYVAGYCDTCNEWSDYLLESDGKFLCDECRSEPLRLESED